MPGKGHPLFPQGIRIMRRASPPPEYSNTPLTGGGLIGIHENLCPENGRYPGSIIISWVLQREEDLAVPDGNHICRLWSCRRSVHHLACSYIEHGTVAGTAQSLTVKFPMLEPAPIVNAEVIQCVDSCICAYEQDLPAENFSHLHLPSRQISLIPEIRLLLGRHCT